MSLVFSNTTLKNGIIQICERNCGLNDGDISGNAALLAQFTGDINIALDRVWSIILQASGTWQLDDTNQTDYPIVQANLVSGQRDYAFTTDGSGNIILEIFRVAVADTAGIFHEIYPVDQQTPTLGSGNPEDTTTFIDGKNATGIPSRYDKTGNGIFLDVIPSYNSTNGLKVFISRESTYFVSSDTTKKPGFAGIFHEYLALRASYFYALRQILASAKSLQSETTIMERAIQEYYSNREKDTRPRLIANVENTR